MSASIYHIYNVPTLNAELNFFFRGGSAWYAWSVVGFVVCNSGFRAVTFAMHRSQKDGLPVV